MQKDLTQVLDYAVVGAGLTGLSLAYQLKEKLPQKTAAIFEKSKGLGGRLATRRSGGATFDHGAQFIKLSEESKKWTDIWQAAGLAKTFAINFSKLVCAENGMTQFAKYLSKDLDVNLNHRILSLQRANEFWSIKNDQNNEIMAKNIILTCISKTFPTIFTQYVTSQ